MHKSLKILTPIALLVLTACAPAPGVQSSRLDGATLSFAAQPGRMNTQAKALTELSKRMVVQTTIKGAGIGAAVGCGLAVVSSGNASKCVAAAAVGAAGGAVVGHMAGKHQVAKQIELVPTSAVVRTLRKTTAQMDLIQTSLPLRLAAHEEILAQLDLQRASGTINEKKFTASRAKITTERQAIASALMQAEADANQAAANLRSAQSQGQTGLDWHITATSELASRAHSARSAMSLL